MEAIMDLISNVNHIENKLGGRNSDQNKGKPKKITRHDAPVEPHVPDQISHPTDKADGQLGQIIDTNA